MEISLTQGMVAQIDDADWPLVTAFSWSVSIWLGRPYAVTRKPQTNKFLRMHRLILGVDDPSVFVDHINGDSLDNRRVNLRTCTHRQNLGNSRRSLSNTSGYKGVSWAAHAGQWRAVIVHDRRHIHLGYFADPESAARAYDREALRLRGEFARVNYPAA